MKIFHRKFIIAAILCSNISLFCMYSPTLIDAITFYSVYKKNDLPKSALGIKSLENKDPEWKNILDNESHIHDLFFCIEDEEKLKLAAFLGTPGAIAFGKTFIKKNLLAKGILRNLLDSTAHLTKEECVWENQDINVATNILRMTTIEELKCARNCYSALIIAASHGKTEFVKLLLDHGVDTEYKDTTLDYKTALMAASYYGHSNVLDLLIERKANVNASTDRKTALLLAIDATQTYIIEKLIIAGADVNDRNGEGRTPLSIAKKYHNTSYYCGTKKEKEYEKIIQMLLDAGATQ